MKTLHARHVALIPIIALIACAASSPHDAALDTIRSFYQANQWSQQETIAQVSGQFVEGITCQGMTVPPRPPAQGEYLDQGCGLPVYYSDGYMNWIQIVLRSANGGAWEALGIWWRIAPGQSVGTQTDLGAIAVNSGDTFEGDVFLDTTGQNGYVAGNIYACALDQTTNPNGANTCFTGVAPSDGTVTWAGGSWDDDAYNASCANYWSAFFPQNAGSGGTFYALTITPTWGTPGSLYQVSNPSVTITSGTYNPPTGGRNGNCSFGNGYIPSENLVQDLNLILN